MAKPAFIYAFDNIGADRFVELCGLILASRYKGFLLGGIGPDGGIDGELDEILGYWNPEILSPLLHEVIQPGKQVVFQFKHKVVARVGQARTREQLFSLYKCQPSRVCELHNKLVQSKKPQTYVLVTNVEVNSEFRNKFIAQCKNENSDIEHYQIIGLDELEAWITSEVQLRHLYFPTIFGEPRFNLKIKIDEGFAIPSFSGMDFDFDDTTALFQVSVLNVGTVTSYVNSVSFSVIVDGEQKYFHILDFGDPILGRINPKFGTPIEPGRKQVFYFPFEILKRINKQGTNIFPSEVIVFDEIGNQYSETIPEELRNKILE